MQDEPPTTTRSADSPSLSEFRSVLSTSSPRTPNGLKQLKFSITPNRVQPDPPTPQPYASLSTHDEDSELYKLFHAKSIAEEKLLAAELDLKRTSGALAALSAENAKLQTRIRTAVAEDIAKDKDFSKLIGIMEELLASFSTMATGVYGFAIRFGNEVTLRLCSGADGRGRVDGKVEEWKKLFEQYHSNIDKHLKSLQSLPTLPTLSAHLLQSVQSCHNNIKRNIVWSKLSEVWDEIGASVESYKVINSMPGSPAHKMKEDHDDSYDLLQTSDKTGLNLVQSSTNKYLSSSNDPTAISALYQSNLVNSSTNPVVNPEHLTRQLAKNTEQLSLLSSIYSSSLLSYHSLSGLLDRSRINIANRQREIEQIRADNARMDSAIAELHREEASVEKSLVSVMKEREEKKVVMSRVLAMAEEREERARSEVERIEGEIKGIEEMIAVAEENTRSKMNEIDELQARLPKLQETKANIEATLKELEEKSALHTKTLDTLKAEITQLESLLSDKCRDNINSQFTVRTNEERLGLLRTRVLEKRIEVEGADSGLKEANGAVNKLQLELEFLSQKVALVQAQTKQTQEKIPELTKQVEEKRVELADATAALAKELPGSQPASRQPQTPHPEPLLKQPQQQPSANQLSTPSNLVVQVPSSAEESGEKGKGMDSTWERIEQVQKSIQKSNQEIKEKTKNLEELETKLEHSMRGLTERKERLEYLRAREGSLHRKTKQAERALQNMDEEIRQAENKQSAGMQELAVLTPKQGIQEPLIDTDVSDLKDQAYCPLFNGRFFSYLILWSVILVGGYMGYKYGLWEWIREMIG
jgi:predicted  nucleic acid-binding Zn-ribbon protein